MMILEHIKTALPEAWNKRKFKCYGQIYRNNFKYWDR